MKRRRFIWTGVVCGVVSLLPVRASHSGSVRSLEGVAKTIGKVQAHLFPEGSPLPSASSSDAVGFVMETIHHPRYDRDIRAFVIEGARDLVRRERGLVAYTPSQMEQALRAYEQTSRGRAWLHRIMILSLEALLSDPLYGGNKGAFGWRVLGTWGGVPRPTEQYGGL